MELYENKTDVNEKRISPPTDMRSDYYHTLIYIKTPLYHSDSQKWF